VFLLAFLKEALVVRDAVFARGGGRAVPSV
jgi:hypothetical protein